MPQKKIAAQVTVLFTVESSGLWVLPGQQSVCLSPSQSHRSFLTSTVTALVPEKLPREPPTSWEMHLFFKMLISVAQGENKALLSNNIQGRSPPHSQSIWEPKLQSNKPMYLCTSPNISEMIIEQKKMKKPKIQLPKESRAPKCSQSWQTPLRETQTSYFSQFYPQTKLQEQPQPSPESRHHAQLALGSVPFFKNRSLNGASFRVLLLRWSLDIIESFARGSPTVMLPPPSSKHPFSLRQSPLQAAQRCSYS